MVVFLWCRRREMERMNLVTGWHWELLPVEFFCCVRMRKVAESSFSGC